MKKGMVFWAAVLFIAVPLSSQNRLADSLAITTQEWEPYNYTMPDGSVGGMATDILRKVLDEMKVPYTITVYPWFRAQMLVKSGEADAFYAASRNRERDAYATMSDIIADQNTYWYLPKDSELDPDSPDFIKKAVVTALSGSNMLKYLETHHFDIKGSPDTMDSLVMILAFHRVDAILANAHVATIYFKKNQINEDNFKKVLCQEQPLGIYFSNPFLQKYPWFLEEFNSTLKTIKAEDD